ncbi:PTS sugar transporter subunit IIA [Lactobacillus sp. ESL0680]|uniref:BglG family transcription antiterminator n=1 Tax=Lactobacillus sp. ESL0680 TaxID=2983210 RepID=UPI0023F7A453|nr:PTS sugar transporter subunit IIA [Lactobacillus sp. ESL0680]WEV38469.1 PTS sugar transporter subunit IIA [Lactobacillus sp. ESL0680]
METFNISRRTAFNWLSSINQELQKNNLAEIINIPRYGYKMPDQTKKVIERHSNRLQVISKSTRTVVNAPDRQTIIVLYLIGSGKNVSINELADRFACSRNTIIKDFKIIKSRFPLLEITSSRTGHRIASNETAIRLTIYELLLHHNKLAFTFIKKLNYPIAATRKLVVQAQQKLRMSFSENSIQQLTYWLMFSKWRIMHHHCLQNNDDYSWIADNTKGVLGTCSKLLLKLTNQNCLNGEVTFLSKIMLCSQATEVTCVKPSLYHDLANIAQEIIFRYEQLTEQQISYKLFTKVLCNHLYATFFRVKFGIPFYSNEVDEIKRQYPELVKFTAIACAPLEQYLQKKLPTEEVALICLYFGSINSKGYQDFSNGDKLKRASLAEVLVVCSSGIGTSAMLYHELSRLYPLIKFSPPLEIHDLEQIFTNTYQARLIVSTAPLKEATYPIPIVNVKAVLTKHDQSIIESFLREKVPRKIEHNASAVDSLVSIINEYAEVKDENGLRLSLDKFIFPDNNKSNRRDLPNLGSLLPAKRIKFIHNRSNLSWQQVLQVGCDLLEQDALVDNLYFKKISDLINKYGPYMLISSNIFLAHAAPSSSNKAVGLSLILLDQPLIIQAHGQKATVICMFVLSPGLQREHERALEQLVDIIRNEKNVDKLLNAKTSQEVRKFLLSFS